MSETELTKSAKLIADAVMRGEYGSIVSDEGIEEPEAGSYAGWDKIKTMDKKQVMIISGVVLGVLLVAGAAAGGFWYYKKNKTT
jgi:hypothetical protein